MSLAACLQRCCQVANRIWLFIHAFVEYSHCQNGSHRLKPSAWGGWLGGAPVVFAQQSGGPIKSHSLLFALILLPTLSLAGCAVFPAAAPTASELLASTQSELNYPVVKFNSQVVAALSEFHPSFGAVFQAGHYVGNNRLAAGDTIAITVYESGGQSLFPPPAVVPGAAATSNPVGAVSTGASNIPPQTVEADGTIFVPFVGRLNVAGKTPGQVGQMIETALQGKAISPQVIVTLVNNVGNAASVGGEVNSPRLVPLSAGGERLLDVIASAGGAKWPAYETYVTVVRKGVVGKVLLQTIVNDPRENISVRPRDQIYLSRNPRTFAVMGATMKVAVYPFLNEKVSLAEAIATGGGPVDTVGNPSGIYLFRFEPFEIAKKVAPPGTYPDAGPHPDVTPVLYQLDMRSADGYFLAQAIQMRDKDVVLITDSESVQLQKLMAVVRNFTGVAYDLKRAGQP